MPMSIRFTKFKGVFYCGEIFKFHRNNSAMQHEISLGFLRG